jgi:hypothetical protein
MVAVPNFMTKSAAAAGPIGGRHARAAATATPDNASAQALTAQVLMAHVFMARVAVIVPSLKGFGVAAGPRFLWADYSVRTALAKQRKHGRRYFAAPAAITFFASGPHFVSSARM